MFTAGGQCSPVSGTCIVASTPAQACPNGNGCASATACNTGCQNRSNCASPYSDCNTVTGQCFPDQASQLAGQQGITPAATAPPPRLTNQEIAAMMADAGFPEDDAGVFYFVSSDRNAPIVKSFDPSISTPLTLFRNCMEYIETCALVNSGNFDGCVAKASRCATSTPWVSDPAGIECCPESCLVLYLQTREAQAAAVSLETVAQSTCVFGNVGGTDAGASDSGGDQ
jgi:hypothetical protein